MLNELLNDFFASKNAKRWTMAILLLPFLLFGFSWVYGHSFITVSVDNAQAGNVTYVFTDQGSGKTTNVVGPASGIKRIVHKGSYEIIAEQSSGTYISVANAGGFLKTTHVHGALSAEEARKFVGNEPSPCMYYTGSLLYSYDCKGSLAEGKLHVPATPTQPTYTKVRSITAPGDNPAIEGLVTTAEGTFMLVYSNTNDPLASAHTLYQVQGDLTLSGGQQLLGLNNSTGYSIEPYKTGFIIFDAGFENTFYYESAAATPVSLAIPQKKSSNLEIYAHSIRGDAIAVSYANQDYEPSSKVGEKVTDKSTITILQNNKIKEFAFDTAVGTMRLCGNAKLCLLTDKLLSVYDISGNTQKLLYSLGSVVSIEDAGQDLLISRGGGVFRFDVEKRSGFVSYSFGDATYCGISVDATGYTVCASANRIGKVALRIDAKTINTDGIDKKVFNLTKTSEISAVSVYDRYIFISPNLGDPVFNYNTGYYDYDQATRQRVNADIDQLITKLGFDTQKYTIVNTSK
jgi:hypothetical protein